MFDGLKRTLGLNRQSSDGMVSLAQRALKRPETITDVEVKSLAASVLSQARK